MTIGRPNIYISILLLFFSISLAGQKSFKKKYADLLEPGSKLILSGYTYTVEKINDNKFVLKEYYPETRQLTFRYTYDSKKLDNLKGLYEEYYDDGTLIARGNFVNNVKQGNWLEEKYDRGLYKNGHKTGVWIRTDDKGRIIGKGHYVQGIKHGLFNKMDTMGAIRISNEYANDKLISTYKDSTFIDVNDSTSVHISARFPGCEDQNISDNEKKKCADKLMLHFVYNKIKYPPFGRKNGIQGQVLLNFIIEIDGSISNIIALHGLSKEFKEHCIDIVKSMPRWTPAKINGEPVRIHYNLPINFRLN